MKRNHSTRLSQPVFLVTVVLIAMVCAIAILTALAGSRSAARSAEANHADSSAISMPASSPQLEAEVITILPNGFEPTEIRRPAGKFLLAIENRSGLSSVDFTLRTESGSRIFQGSRTLERSDWNDVVNPSPGTYELTEANHPTWRCVITITR